MVIEPRMLNVFLCEQGTLALIEAMTANSHLSWRVGYFLIASNPDHGEVVMISASFQMHDESIPLNYMM